MLFWFLSGAASVFGMLAILELAGIVHHWVQGGGFFYGRATSLAPAQATDPRASDVFRFSPYAGFAHREGLTAYEYLNRRGRGREVLQQKTGSREIPDWAALASNNHGFFFESDYPLERDGDSLDVAIFGGSVGQWLAIQGRGQLEAELSRWARPRGKTVRVLNFAHSGYKQPQQLLLLAYFLSVGQRFDVVVNLDGFNEASLGRINQLAGVDATMPMAILMRQLAGVASADTNDHALAHLGKLAGPRIEVIWLSERRDRARFASDYLISTLLMNRAAARIAELSASAGGDADAEERLSLQEPRETSTRPIARDWARASRLMALLTEWAGGLYLHVLQPNQYFGRHAFTPSERRIAIDPNSRHRPGVELGYPLLQQEGRALASSGVAFVDATDLFDERQEAVYADDCCHYNTLGNELLATRIAADVIGLLERRDAADYRALEPR